jgi:hypothetical protein
MRFVMIAAVLGVGSSFAFAGPSDHAGRPFGEPGRLREIHKSNPPVRAPYALTGGRTQRRVAEFHDIPQGRGQTGRAAYWKWVTE